MLVAPLLWVFLFSVNSAEVGPLGLIIAADVCHQQIVIVTPTVDFLRLVGRRADFSRIFIFEKSWSKRKQAFEPQGAMMDTHTLPLIACAWQLLCEMPSSQGSRDGVGTPPQDRPLGCRRFFRRFCAHFCVTLKHLFFKAPKLLRKISGKSAQKSAQTSAH